MKLSHISKLPDVGTTIFTQISKLAAENNALNVSQGYPDFPADPELIELVNQAMNAGKNQYAPMPGLPVLRKRLTEKMNSAYGSDYDSQSDIVLTAGATQAIFTAISAFIRQGDEVIVFKPAYDCYEPAIELFGGKPVLIQMKFPEYVIDWEEVRQKITSRTKMIVVNSPHNPTGNLLTDNDLEELEEIVRGTDTIILSDEVYEHITFDDQPHLSIAGNPELAARALITFSFGKTFHVTGWKLGYCLGPEYLMSEFKKVHQYNVFSVNHPMQVAIEQYLHEPDHYLGLSKFYQQKRDKFLSMISGSRFSFTPSCGTYFQLLNFRKISSESDMDFARRLIEEYKIAGIPVSAFSKNNTDNSELRFCFAKTDETLEKAAEVLNKI